MSPKRVFVLEGLHTLLLLRSAVTVYFYRVILEFLLHITVFLWLQDRVFPFQNNPKNLDPSYKMDLDLWDCLGVFPFQNNPKNLDPSYKMDLDLWDCLGRVKLIL